MGPALEIAPFTPADIEVLYRPGAEDVQEAVDDALLMLHELFVRYAGSPFEIQIPEEARAVELLDRALARMPADNPHRLRLMQDRAAYDRLRDRYEREGPSAETERAAREAADMLHEQWTALIEYPLTPDPVAEQRSGTR
jgi:hypothetical protein